MGTNENLLVTLKVTELKLLIEDVVLACLNKVKTQKSEKIEEDNCKSELIPRVKVAKFFSISTVTLDKWIKWGKLPKPIKQSSRVYFYKDDIENMMNNKSQNFKSLKI